MHVIDLIMNVPGMFYLLCPSCYVITQISGENSRQTDSPFIRFCRISVLPLSQFVGIYQSLFSVIKQAELELEFLRSDML